MLNVITHCFILSCPQVDFSENAAIISQNEIQAAHWTHGQATLFTAHAWVSQGVTESTVLILDNLSHTKVSVYTFMEAIFQHLKEKFPTIHDIAVFSDGASSQFKQRFLFANLFLWESSSSCKIVWNYFATSHGKGAVDGLGGTVKNSVWRFMKTACASATTAEEYATLAKERNLNIHIQFISHEAMEQKEIFLKQHWEGVFCIPRTHRIHVVCPDGPNKVQVAEISTGTFTLIQMRKGAEETKELATEEAENSVEGDSAADSAKPTAYKAGDWVVVKYDGRTYPGEILTVRSGDVEELEVKAMHPTGRYW